MLDLYLQILGYIFKFFGIVILIVIAVILPFFIVSLVYYIQQLIKGRRLKKRTLISTYVPRNLFLKIFIDFPKRIVEDRFEFNPDDFNHYYGFWLFAGEQGSGKSIAMAEFLRRIKQQYPKCVIRSNIDISFQDSKIQDAEDLVFNNNGSWGQVEAIDEIQNWFNSSESRNFPPELIQEVCQQRKQFKMIVGTSQCFNRVALPLRQQVNYLCKPMTIFGALTIVRVYKPQVAEDGTIKKLRRYKTYCFVHDEELRNSYDTRETVKRLSLKGFKPRSEQLKSDILETIENTKSKFVSNE